MTHRDSDVLGRYTAPAAPVQGEEIRFHPDQSLPGCMMPDGGDCCAGHAAVVDDWHKQRKQIDAIMAENKACYQRIDELEAALKEIVANAELGEWTLPSSFAGRARNALKPEAGIDTLEPFPAESGA